MQPLQNKGEIIPKKRQPTSLHVDEELWTAVAIAVIERKTNKTQAVEAALRMWLGDKAPQQQAPAPLKLGGWADMLSAILQSEDENAILIVKKAIESVYALVLRQQREKDELRLPEPAADLHHTEPSISLGRADTAENPSGSQPQAPPRRTDRTGT